MPSHKKKRERERRLHNDIIKHRFESNEISKKFLPFQKVLVYFSGSRMMAEGWTLNSSEVEVAI